MTMPRSVQDWFLLITESDDAKLAKQAIAELDDHWLPALPRQLHVLNLLTAIRLDQMAKEGSA